MWPPRRSGERPKLHLSGGLSPESWYNPRAAEPQQTEPNDNKGGGTADGGAPAAPRARSPLPPLRRPLEVPALPPSGPAQASGGPRGPRWPAGRAWERDFPNLLAQLREAHRRSVTGLAPRGQAVSSVLLTHYRGPDRRWSPAHAGHKDQKPADTGAVSAGRLPPRPVRGTDALPLSLGSRFRHEHAEAAQGTHSGPGAPPRQRWPVLVMGDRGSPGAVMHWAAGELSRACWAAPHRGAWNLLKGQRKMSRRVTTQRAPGLPPGPLPSPQLQTPPPPP